MRPALNGVNARNFAYKYQFPRLSACSAVFEVLNYEVNCNLYSHEIFASFGMSNVRNDSYAAKLQSI
jgi:hypothetical protein